MNTNPVRTTQGTSYRVPPVTTYNQNSTYTPKYSNSNNGGVIRTGQLTGNSRTPSFQPVSQTRTLANITNTHSGLPTTYKKVAAPKYGTPVVT